MMIRLILAGKVEKELSFLLPSLFPPLSLPVLLSSNLDSPLRQLALGIYDLYGLGGQLTLDTASTKDNIVVASKQYGWITKINYEVAFGTGVVKDPWVYYEGDFCTHITRGDVCDVDGNKRLSNVGHVIRLVVAPKRETLNKGKWK